MNFPKANHPRIIVCGLPGSGKSYFASRLAERLGVTYVNSDIGRRKLFPHRSYSREETDAVYDSMLERLKNAMGQGEGLIIDATFHQQAMRERCRECDPGILFFEVVADEQVIQERLGRPREVSEAGFAVYEMMKNKWEPFREDHLVLTSTNTNIEEMLQQSLTRLFQ